MRVPVYLILRAHVCMRDGAAVCVVRALVAAGASSGVTFRKSQKLEGGGREENPHPLTPKDSEDFESPSPTFPPGLFFCCQSC